MLLRLSLLFFVFFCVVHSAVHRSGLRKTRSNRPLHILANNRNLLNDAIAVKKVFTAVYDANKWTLGTDGWLEYVEGESPCSWGGVTCANVAGEDRVTELGLIDSGASGEIPEDLGELTELTLFDITNCFVTRLPEGLGKLTKLKYISLDYNPLTELPQSIGNLVNIQEFYATALGRQFKAVPPSFGGLQSVRRINLDQNGLEEIPLEFCSLVSISELFIQDNLFRTVPDCLFRLPLLRVVRLAANQLISLPDSLATAPSLKLFDIASNNYRGPVPCSPTVTTMYLQFNSLLDHEPATPCLPQLLTFIGSNNPTLTTINVLRSSRATLRSLDLSSTPVNSLTLARVLKELTGITTLTLRDCEINIPIHSFLSYIQPTATNVLQFLDLSHNPQMGGSISEVDFIKIDVDYSTWTFQAMISMSLRNTSLASLDDYQYENFPNLRSLDLRDNPTLDHIPTLFNFLQTMDIRGSIPVLDVDPALYEAATDDSQTADATLHASCPSAIITGEFSAVRIFVDPEQLQFRFCSCFSGFFGNPAEDGNPCQECPKGTDAAIDYACEEGLLRTTADGGAWPIVKYADDGNLTRFDLLTCPGDGESNPCLGVEISSLTALSDVSANDTALGEVVTCKDGYQGRLCSQCAPDYYMSSRTCKSCGAPTFVISPMVSFIALFLIGVKTLRSGTEVKSGMFRTLVMHIQLYSSLPLNAVKLPTSFLDFLRYVQSGTSISIDGAECTFEGVDGFYFPYAYNVISPVILIFVSLIVTFGYELVQRLFPKRRKTVLVDEDYNDAPPATDAAAADADGAAADADGAGQGGNGNNNAVTGVASSSSLAFSSRRSLVHDHGHGSGWRMPRWLHETSVTWLYLWTVVIFAVMKRIFGTMNCTSYGDPSGAKWVARALWVSCDSSRYKSVLYSAVFFGPVFLLITIAYVTAAVLLPVARLPKPMRTFRGIMEAPYREGRGYWEIVQLMKRVLIALVQVLSPISGYVLAFLLVGVLSLSLVLHVWARPFYKKIDNLMESLSLSILFLSFLIVFRSDGGLGGFAFFCFLLNTGFITAVLLMLIRSRLKRLFRSRKSDPVENADGTIHSERTTEDETTPFTPPARPIRTQSAPNVLKSSDMKPVAPSYMSSESLVDLATPSRVSLVSNPRSNIGYIDDEDEAALRSPPPPAKLVQAKVKIISTK